MLSLYSPCGIDFDLAAIITERGEVRDRKGLILF